jgi:hypothetical protein
LAALSATHHVDPVAATGLGGLGGGVLGGEGFATGMGGGTTTAGGELLPFPVGVKCDTASVPVRSIGYT